MIFLSFLSLRVDSVYSIQGYDAILRSLAQNIRKLIPRCPRLRGKNNHCSAYRKWSSWVHWVNAEWRFSNAEPNFFFTFNDPRHRFHRMDSLWEINSFVELIFGGIDFMLKVHKNANFCWLRFWILYYFIVSYAWFLLHSINRFFLHNLSKKTSSEGKYMIKKVKIHAFFPCPRKYQILHWRMQKNRNKYSHAGELILRDMWRKLLTMQGSQKPWPFDLLQPKFLPLFAQSPLLLQVPHCSDIQINN